MNGSLTVVAKGAAIPSQADVNAKAQAQIDQFARPLASTFNDAKKGRYPVKLNAPYKFVFAGYGSPAEQDVHGYGSVSEFLPKKVDIRVGDTLRWLVVADQHNMAFHVPSYFPEFSVAKDGTVTWNPQAVGPVASVALPQSQNSGPGPPPKEVTPQITDGGTYDGSHFISSGLGGAVMIRLVRAVGGLSGAGANSRVSFPVAASNSRTVPSAPAAATTWPSGRKARA